MHIDRHALDAAQARFEEANRTHQVKREQVLTAVGKRKAEVPHTLEECATVNSLPRSSTGNSNTGGDDRHDPPAIRLSQDRIAASPDQGRASCSSSTVGTPLSPRDCADEVKREAALLYGIGRAPVSPEISPPRAPVPGSATPSPDLVKRVGSSEGKTSDPITNPLRSELPRNGCAPASASEELSSRARQSSPSSPSSPLPKLAWAIPNGVCGVRGGHHTVNGGGGGTTEEGRQQQSTRDFAPMGGDGRRAGMRMGSPSDRNSVHSRSFPSPGRTEYPARLPATSAAFVHRSAATRDAMSSMSQTPGSPSASGETDSDHSDSTTGPGATQDNPGSEKQQQEAYELRGNKRDAAHMSGYRHGSDEGKKQRWEGRSRRVKVTPEGSAQERNGYVAPLARLAAVATAGTR